MSVPPPDKFDKEEVLRIFREIDRSSEITQRKLSSSLGISLGKVNFLINALIERGYVKVENFRNASKKISYFYYLTPRGMAEKTRMTSLFLKRKISEYEELDREIRLLREEVRGSGLSSEEQGKSGNRYNR